MQDFRCLVATALVTGGVLVAQTARAQTAGPGQYSGMDSDGYAVSLVVFDDAKGQPFLGLTRVVGYFYCNGVRLLTNGQPLPYGAAVELGDTPIVNGTVSFAGMSNSLSAMSGTVTFNGSTATGTLTGYSPFYLGVRTPPVNNTAKLCRTHELTFTATAGINP